MACAFWFVVDSIMIKLFGVSLSAYGLVAARIII